MSTLRKTLALVVLCWTPLGVPGGFDRFEELVHIVNVKASAKNAFTASGTGFVVDPHGQFVTNYDVVAPLFKDGKIDKTFQLYVKVREKEYLAEILKVDILNDLAPLKIPVEFKEKVAIRSEPLAKGERIYALGSDELDHPLPKFGRYGRCEFGIVASYPKRGQVSTKPGQLQSSALTQVAEKHWEKKFEPVAN